MDRRKIDVSDLRIGMNIVEPDRPWLETPFLFQGFPLVSDDQVQQVREICQYVYIDEESARLIENRPGIGPQLSATALAEDAKRTRSLISHYRRETPYEKNISFEEGLARGREVVAKARAQVDNMFEDVRMGRSIDTAAARSVVRTMVDTIIGNPDAMLWYTQLKKRDEYTAIHSLNVCIFSIAFGRHMEFHEDALNDIGFGALLHDIGKMRVPLEILNKPGKLTDEEFAQMRLHPGFGKEVLELHQGIPASAIDIAYAHHERVNGSGYPLGLSGGEISLFARMVGIVDVYDAITSNRVYHNGLGSSEALDRLFKWRNDHFDMTLIEGFIQCVGIYPVGSLVELSSGEVGLVTQINRQQRLRPSVTLILDEKKNPYFPPRVVDLAATDDPDRVRDYQITRVLAPETYKVDMGEYLLHRVPAALAAGS